MAWLLKQPMSNQQQVHKYHSWTFSSAQIQTLKHTHHSVIWMKRNNPGENMCLVSQTIKASSRTARQVITACGAMTIQQRENPLSALTEKMSRLQSTVTHIRVRVTLTCSSRLQILESYLFLIAYITFIITCQCYLLREPLSNRLAHISILYHTLFQEAHKHSKSETMQ